MNKFIKYLLCFFVGFLLARMIGDGFSVGGVECDTDTENLYNSAKTIYKVSDLYDSAKTISKCPDCYTDFDCNDSAGTCKDGKCECDITYVGPTCNEKYKISTPDCSTDRDRQVARTKVYRACGKADVNGNVLHSDECLDYIYNKLSPSCCKQSLSSLGMYPYMDKCDAPTSTPAPPPPRPPISGCYYDPSDDGAWENFGSKGYNLGWGDKCGQDGDTGCDSALSTCCKDNCCDRQWAWCRQRVSGAKLRDCVEDRGCEYNS